MRNRFLDPLTGDSYEWQVNHAPDGESEFGIGMEVEWLTVRGGLPIPQVGQGDEQVLQISGAILHRNQLDRMIDFAKVCKVEGRTIYWRDFRGEEYEVLITRFNPKRIGVLRNLRDTANAPDHYWKYDLTMVVVRVISGAWA